MTIVSLPVEWRVNRGVLVKTKTMITRLTTEISLIYTQDKNQSMNKTIDFTFKQTTKTRRTLLPSVATRST